MHAGEPGFPEETGSRSRDSLATGQSRGLTFASFQGVGPLMAGQLQSYRPDAAPASVRATAST